jgi:hypothetical protein
MFTLYHCTVALNQGKQQRQQQQQEHQISMRSVNINCGFTEEYESFICAMLLEACADEVKR